MKVVNSVRLTNIVNGLPYQKNALHNSRSDLGNNKHKMRQAHNRSLIVHGIKILFLISSVTSLSKEQKVTALFWTTEKRCGIWSSGKNPCKIDDQCERCADRPIENALLLSFRRNILKGRTWWNKLHPINPFWCSKALFKQVCRTQFDPTAPYDHCVQAS